MCVCVCVCVCVIALKSHCYLILIIKDGYIVKKGLGSSKTHYFSEADLWSRQQYGMKFFEKIVSGLKMLDMVSWNCLWFYIFFESKWFDVVGGFLTSTSSFPQRLKQVPNRKPNNVSVERIHGVPLLRLYNVSC